jgi:hypothetical protein
MIINSNIHHKLLHFIGITIQITKSRCCCILSEMGSTQVLIHHQQPDGDREKIWEIKTRFNNQIEDTKLCLLFLSIVHIQIHTHLKWGGYG